MRLFLAVNLPDQMKKRLYELGQGLKPFGKLKLVEEENIHLTLKFLGDAEPGPVIEALRSVKQGSFTISLKGIGVFPSLGYIRVVWTGCEKGTQDVVTLHDKVEATLPGFKRDKDFHPHATLARVKFPKDKKGLVGFVEENKGKELGEFEVHSFELMKSELGREGPKYEEVESFSL